MRPAHPSSRRSALRCGCAVLALFAAMGAQAQVAPDALPQAPDQPLLVSTTGATMTVTPVLPRTIINWQRYDIGSAATVEYVNPAGVPVLPTTVLNRVVGVPGRAVPTTIYESNVLGTLRSADNISVYLVNPAGILFGPDAAVSVGSLIASTRDISDNDFLGGTLRFRVIPPFGTAAPPVLSGSQTVTAGSTDPNGFRATAGIVGLIAARVVTAGTINAAQELVVVAANDTTLTLSDDDSPLTVRIDEGTELGNPMLLRGALNGSSILVAAATRNDVAAGLLDISADMTATSAYASDQGIVLAAGRTSSLAPSVEMPEFVGESDGENAGVLGIRLGGTLTSTVGTAADAAGGGIDIRALNGVGAPDAVGGVVTPAALTATAGVYALVDQESLTLGTIGADSLSLTASAGSITAGAITIGAGATTISATPGEVEVGNAPGVQRGGVTLAGLTAGGAVTVSGGDITADAGVQSSGGSVALTATPDADYGATGAIATAVAHADGASSDLTISAADLRGIGPSGRAALRAGRDVAATVGGPALLGTVDAGRDIRLSATTLDATALSASGAAQATATTGALALGSSTSTGLTTLRAATALTASGTIRSSAGAVDARGASVDVAGASAGTDLDLLATGGALSVGTAGAVGSARLVSQTGAATAGSLNGGTDAILTAATRATLTGGGVVGRDLRVTGSEVRLGGGGAVEQAAGRNARYTATAGTIAGTSASTGLLIRSDTNQTDAAVGAIVLDASTGIDLRGVALVTGAGAANTGDVGVRLGTVGAPLVLDRVAARALGVTDPLRFIDGDVTLGRVDLVNGLTIATPGAITVDSVAISGAAQTLILASNAATFTATGALSAPGGVRVGGRDAVSIASVTASAGPVELASLTSTITASGDVLGRDDVSVDAPGAISLRDVRSTAGTVQFLSTGAAPTGGISAGAVQAYTDLGVSRAAGVSFASARSETGAVSLAAPGGLVTVAGPTTAATSATLTGASLDLGSVTAGTFATLTASGGVEASGAINAVGAVTVDAPGAIRLDDVRSSGGTVLFRSTLAPATGTIVADEVRAAGSLVVDRAPGLSFGSATSDTGAVSLTSTAGNVAVNGLTRGGTNVTVGANGVTLRDVEAGSGVVSLTANTGSLTASAVSAGSFITGAARTDLSLASAAAGGRVVLSTTTGRIDVDGAITSRDHVSVDAGGGVQLGSVTDTGTTASLLRSRGGPLVAGGPTSVGGALTVDGRDGVTTAAVTSTGGAVTIAAASGPVTASGAVQGRGAVGISARDAIGLQAVTSDTGAVTIVSAVGGVGATAIDAGTAIDVRGQGSVAIGSARARAGNAALTSSGGDAAVGALTASGNASVAAGGTARLTGGVSAGGDLAVTGGSVVLGTAGTSVTQAASGRVQVTSTGGAISGLAGLTLRSDAGGAGARDLTLQSAGDIAFAPGTLLAGGPDRQSALRLGAAAGAPIVLDAVEARTIASPGTATSLSHAGPVTVERIGARDTLAIAVTGAGAPALTVGPVEVRAGDLSLDAAGALSVGAVTTPGGATTLAGASVTGGTVGARAVSVTARSGAVTLGAVDATAGSVGVTASGDIRLPRATATGALTLTSTGGDVTGPSGPMALASSGGAVTVRASATDGTRGVVSLDTVAGAGGIDLAGRTITAETLASSAGGVTVNTRRDGAGIADQRITLGSIEAAGPIALSTGNVAATANGAVALDRARSSGGSIAVTTVGGGFAGRTAGVRPVLEAPAGAITLTIGGPLAIGTASAGGNVSLTSSGAASVTGPVTAGGNYRVDATSVAIGTAGIATRQAGADVAVVARTGAITAEAGTTLAATRGVTLTADGANGAITLSPDSTLAASSGDVVLATRGTAALGSVSAPAGAVRIDAADAALTRAVSGQSVTLTNVATTGTTRLGNPGVGNETEFGAGGTRFDLTNAEVALVSAPSVTIASGARDVVVGALTLGSATGATRFAITANGRVDMLGRLVASGSTGSRTIAIGNPTGGTGAPTGVIRVAATPADGGRLVVDGAALELTAERIGVGYDRDFLDAIGYRSAGLPVEQVTRDYVARPTSTLYNAGALGAPPYSDLVLVRAGTLTLTYGRYALIQNTGRPGEQNGVVIGTAGSTNPNGASLRLRTPGGGDNTFGFFGTIDGISSSAAALLGPDRLEVGAGVSPVASRINGCVIGSGAGCLNTSIAQPSLNLFDTSRAEIVRTADDLTLPFDPLIGTNNEALYLDPGAATAADDCEGDKPCPPRP